MLIGDLVLSSVLQVLSLTSDFFQSNTTIVHEIPTGVFPTHQMYSTMATTLSPTVSAKFIQVSYVPDLNPCATDRWVLCLYFEVYICNVFSGYN